MPDSPHMSRREFVQVVTIAVGTIMGAAIGLPAIGYLIAPALQAQEADAWVLLGPLESFPVGTPTLANFVRTKVNGWEKTANSYGIYIVRGQNDEITVFSNTCTHLGCRVTWKEDIQEYVCPCHDGKFSPDGSVNSGPPPRPLDKYESKVEEGNLLIHFVEA